MLHTCSKQKSEQWVCFNDNLLDSATNLLLFASSTIYLYSQHWWQQQDDMYCRQNETCTICLERIEHILHVWKHEDMSWNSFIAEYLKLNRKKTAWMTRIVSLLERHESTVSLLQRRVQYWSHHWARHLIVSLLQWHESIVSLLQWHQILRRNKLETSDEMSLKRFMMTTRNRLETSDEMSLKHSMK